jgi:precorrin-3B C17-methyltransferase
LALQEAEVVIGYGLYVDAAKPFLGPETKILASGMTKELERASLAIDLALTGQKVAVVSGGDAGVYAMAGAVFELIAAKKIHLGSGPEELSVQVIAGLPAFIAGAALLGAPLTHDFCAISLSDRLTPWPVIEKRLDLASQAGFVIALYNPKSRGRDWQLAKAAQILGQNLAPETPVGLTSRIGRIGQKTLITDLARLPQQEVDMQTLIIVGSPKTFIYQGYMITPRGYADKYGDE